MQTPDPMRSQGFETARSPPQVDMVTGNGEDSASLLYKSFSNSNYIPLFNKHVWEGESPWLGRMSPGEASSAIDSSCLTNLGSRAGALE